MWERVGGSMMLRGYRMAPNSFFHECGLGPSACLRHSVDRIAAGKAKKLVIPERRATGGH